MAREKGKIVIQTPEGGRQELCLEGLGIAVKRDEVKTEAKSDGDAGCDAGSDGAEADAAVQEETSVV